MSHGVPHDGAEAFHQGWTQNACPYKVGTAGLAWRLAWRNAAVQAEALTYEDTSCLVNKDVK